MSDIVIRAARADDLSGLTELVNLPGVRAGTGRLPFTSEATVRTRLLETGPNVHSLLAVEHDRPIGWATLICGSGRRSHCGEVFLAVHDDHWGRGIGGRLLTAILDLADNWLGLRRLQLEVTVDNARAVSLYEKFSFEREGTLRAAILRDGQLVDCHVMARLRPAPPCSSANAKTASDATP